MIYFAKRHLGATQIVFGCAMFPCALGIVEYYGRLMGSYGVFDNSLSGQFDSFVYNVIGLQALTFAAVAIVFAEIILIASGIWYASKPPVPTRNEP
jgi:hypothetical protein